MTDETKDMIVLAIFALVVFAFLFAREMYKPNAKTEVKTHVVTQGETLWQIASQYERDPRKLIFEIQEVNGIGSEIRPGMVLKVPIER